MGGGGRVLTPYYPLKAVIQSQPVSPPLNSRGGGICSALLMGLFFMYVSPQGHAKITSRSFQGPIGKK